MSERTRCIQKIGELIDNVQIAMLTTVRRDGRLVSRPLRTIETAKPFNGELWFFVRASSHKADEVEAQPHVNLAYASPDRNTYVSVSGRAKIVESRAKIAELWSPAMTLYFDGPNDRDMVLMRIEVEGAEFWDGPSGWLGQALDLAGGVITGKASPLSDHRAIDLQRGH
jgi:general stress protein 26